MFLDVFLNSFFIQLVIIFLQPLSVIFHKRNIPMLRALFVKYHLWDKLYFVWWLKTLCVRPSGTFCVHFLKNLPGTWVTTNFLGITSAFCCDFKKSIKKIFGCGYFEKILIKKIQKIEKSCQNYFFGSFIKNGEYWP